MLFRSEATGDFGYRSTDIDQSMLHERPVHLSAIEQASSKRCAEAASMRIDGERMSRMRCLRNRGDQKRLAPRA